LEFGSWKILIVDKKEVYKMIFYICRASLETPIFYGILIFPRENELISLGKMRILWEIGVSKLARGGVYGENLRDPPREMKK
jgi:hypothetical protein